MSASTIPERPQATASRPELPEAQRTLAGAVRQGAVIIAGVLVGSASIVGIIAAYPRIPNRYAFGWDGGLRTMGDLEAARAIRHLDPLRFLWQVLAIGPEVWPTLRTLVAAPLLAVLGPSLDAENAITIVAYGAMFALLALAAVRIARDQAGAMLMLAIAAGALAATRPLLNWAAAPYLEVIAALTTLAATLAWIRLRGLGPAATVWPVALLGNLVFHSKYQYGILFALAVLGTEALALDRATRRQASVALRAVARSAARRRSAWIWTVAAASFATVAAVVSRTQGGALSIAGVRVSVSRPYAPITWAAILAFYGTELELWRSRKVLREGIPARMRALWVWLATPMAAWILVPFTWRLRHLLATTLTYGDRAPTRLDALLFYPRSLVHDWYSTPAAAAVLIGVALTVVAAARNAEVRRCALPIAVMCLVEVAVLAVSSRKNFQPRFILNLAPLVALAATLWIPAAGRWLRFTAGSAIALALALALSALWRPEVLATALTEGRMPMPPDVVERCEAVAAAAEFHDATLVNDLDIEHRQDCSLRLDAAAWRRGARLEHWHSKRPLRPEVIHLDESCGAPPEGLPSTAVLASERRPAPAVCVRVYRVAG